ncbi:glycerol-3-phosphate dehydrogenase [Gordonia effusa NBRC 100432]|uniref:Glycerol-3-phosphate dehydrogenase n=1 Tax=Gordonia effusa NBRC 100432 TaxID=1077974 RepID=H0QWQ8_9ACTN|nr:glycerol-3-phosphate dehydrogenase/oxidase [Gordonia effusa]GAB17259.1 glycerol-3-phosphate dehydrogenase [Gordonia effusa NBRC 100432]
MSALTAQRRRADLQTLADRREPLDVLVIGGGVTGCGAALDAASRGLSVALVEAHDLAFGTSRWSSKLVHGGLRYLASASVGIAYESAIERHHLMTTIAPHLVSPLRQVVPDFGERRTKQLVWTGFRAGDALRRVARTPKSVLPGPGNLSVEEMATVTPTVARAGLRGGVGTYDGQLIDDARLVVGIARTAAAFGAHICTYTKASKVSGAGATLTDSLTGESFDISARSVINATGVWAGDVDSTLTIRPSRGTHLVFDAAAFGNPTAALTVPVAGSISRFVFAMPEQLGRVYLGLTDVDAPGAIPDVPDADDEEIDFLLDTVNVALRQPLTRSDIRGTYSGLRPLIDGAGGDGGSLADVSRKHAVRVNDSTLVSIVGGKLTTYRRMAQDAVDAAVKAAGLQSGSCITTSTPLIGATGGAVRRGLPASLVARFGTESARVLDSASIPDATASIANGIDVTRAEVEYAVTHEGALSADDVIERRTRIGLVPDDAARVRQAVEDVVAAAS